MDSVDEIMQLCRLCLVKDEVNTPIFEEEGDIRQIFLKISACLPVKVSKEDNLPKNICDGCSCKLEALYQFWNTSANSEKKLMKWLSQGGIIDKSVSDKHSMNIDPVILKQEVVEVPDDRHSPDDDLVSSDLNVSNDADEYLIQQQQLPYQNVEFQFQQDEFDQTGTDPIIAETGTPSRKRRAAAIRAMANMGTEEEANPDLLEPKIAKTEEESEDSCNEDPEPTTFVGLPSATDNEQAGPSGVGKPAADPPYQLWQMYRLVNVAVINKKQGEESVSKLESCSKCSMTFTTRERLWRHKSNEHRNTPKPACAICGKLFKYLALAKNHEFVHKAGKRFQCDLCDKSFKNSKSLGNHVMYEHHRKSKYKCQECGQIFYNKTMLEVHNRRVHQNVTYSCPDCNKVYKNEEYFNLHRRTHLPDYVPLALSCTVCDNKFSSRQSLHAHVKTHRVDQKYVCDSCGKSIKSLASFKNHLRIHSGEKPFKCKECDKEFSAKRFLVVHERVHTKEKPYCCNLCQKQFTQQGTLAIHLRQHTGERPYSCNICAKSFVSKTNLNAHMRTHKCVLNSSSLNN